jgi:hypothetical protein
MRVVAAVIFVTILSGCTNHLLIRDTSRLSGNREDVARKIYGIAKECWKREETIMKAQIIVENVVTLDSIVVSARFDSFGSHVVNPFIKFVISQASDGTSVDLITQEIPWIGREQHLRDAKNWMAGNYVCSQPK